MRYAVFEDMLLTSVVGSAASRELMRTGTEAKRIRSNSKVTFQNNFNDSVAQEEAIILSNY